MKMKTENIKLFCLQKKQITPVAFTLVELIVVIVILAILASISFLSFSNQSSDARDSTRLSDLAAISKGIGIQGAASGKYPIPDKKIDIFSGTVLIGYQGEAGTSVKSIIRGSSDGFRDPLDLVNYTYTTNKAQNKFQIMAFLENRTTAIFSMVPFGSKASATDYTDRYPVDAGDNLGIFTISTGTTYTPIQDISSVQATGGADIISSSNSGLTVIKDALSSTGVALLSDSGAIDMIIEDYSPIINPVPKTDSGSVAAVCVNLVTTGTDYSPDCNNACSGTLRIGARCGGGIVFNTGSTAMTRLVAAPADDTRTAWHVASNGYATNLTSNDDGQYNTTTMLGINPSNFPAISKCDTKILNGKNDWFLPALNQLDVLHANRNSVGGFTDGTDYYSSSLYGLYATPSAYVKVFGGNWNVWSPNTDTRGIRCVRSF